MLKQPAIFCHTDQLNLYKSWCSKTWEIRDDENRRVFLMDVMIDKGWKIPTIQGNHSIMNTFNSASSPPELHLAIGSIQQESLCPGEEDSSQQ